MQNSKQKSITVNMILNMVKGVMGVIFPLITFPYISRVLGVDKVGEYNFASSIVSYFSLVAELGISTYAIRNGAGIRDNKRELETFVSQIFTINMLSTAISYFLLLFLVIYANSMNGRVIVLILSLQIVFKTIGIEWLYSIYEDYLFITIRSILFQFLALLLMFIFVRSEEDIVWYAIITVVSTAGRGGLGWIRARKYSKVRLTLFPNIKKHIKPILLFFATNLTVIIYVNSDITILGLISGNHAVGIYSVSAKVYSLVKNILASAIIVSIPRMSQLWENKKMKEFHMLGEEIYDTFLTWVIPVIVGIILLSKEIIILIAGIEYIEAQISLIILSIALFFCLGAGFWSQGVMIPQGKEKVVFRVTAISAIVNIILNFMLIPFFQERAAALTTVVAEAIVFFYCRKVCMRSIGYFEKGTIVFKIFVGCIPIVIISMLIGQFISIGWIKIVLIIGMSILIYVIIEGKLGNKTIIKYKNEILNKMRRK